MSYGNNCMGSRINFWGLAVKLAIQDYDKALGSKALESVELTLKTPTEYQDLKTNGVLVQRVICFAGWESVPVFWCSGATLVTYAYD